MSVFDRYTTAEAVDAMRIFLGESRREFMKKYGFTENREQVLGQLPSDASFGQRLTLARDSAGVTDSQIAAAVGVKVDVVVGWRANKGDASAYYKKLAGFLSVPQKWLESGKLLGRLPRYADAPLQALEAKVNAKSARCEAPDTTFGERLTLARDYAGVSDAQIAEALGVSREIIRRWRENINESSYAVQLAEFLGVPLNWLEKGGEAALPANTHLGVRVGGVYRDSEGHVTFVGEYAKNREQMYALTQALLAEVPDDASESFIQAFVENAVFNRYKLIQTARRAGGRFHILNGQLQWAPWIPLEQRELVRRHFSDEVEAMIVEELQAQPTVMGAWQAIEARCKAKGLSEDEYPKRITLHKRVENDRKLAEQFGIDMNDIVRQACEEHAPKVKAKKKAVAELS